MVISVCAPFMKIYSHLGNIISNRNDYSEHAINLFFSKIADNTVSRQNVGTISTREQMHNLMSLNDHIIEEKRNST